MSLDVLCDINWLATLVAAFGYFALGGLWYAPPVLGDVWARAAGHEIPEDEKPDPRVFLVPLVVCTLAAIVTAMLVEATGASGLGDGLVMGLALGLAFGVGLAAQSAVFERKPERAVWLAVTGGYHLVGLTLVAVLLSVW